jgi:hypothetical protein
MKFKFIVKFVRNSFYLFIGNYTRIGTPNAFESTTLPSTMLLQITMGGYVI